MRIRELLKLSIVSIVTTSILYADDSVQEMDSITVTANKVEENLQDVPQSITVIDVEMIEQRGIKNIVDVIREIPNMSTIPDRGIAVNFRGLNASLFTSNNPVVVYIDGIPTSYKRAFNTSLENVERIEVLRGPQGTLYGKDAIGGVINIITKEPTNEISGTVGIEYGMDNYQRADINLNAPIVKDKLFINVNGELEKTDGWVTNTYNGDDKASKSEDKNFGTSLYFKATDNLSTKLVLKKEKNKDYGFEGYGIFGKNGLDLFSRTQAESHAFEMPTLEENAIDSQSLDIRYKTDKYVIDAVTVHREADVDGTYDADYTNGTAYDNYTLFNDASTDTISQEIRVSNSEDDDIRWVAGVYFDKEEKKKDAYGNEYILSGTSLLKTNTISTIDSDTKAIFAQSMIPLDKKLELTLGARYQKIEKEIELNSYFTSGSTTIQTNNYDDDKSSNVFLPKVALSYKMNDSFTPYVSISKGYMPGGFNIIASSSDSDNNTFEAQKSTNYELGIKGAIEDFIFTASVFRMDIKDIHVFGTDSNNAIFTDNAKKAHSQGIEFDFKYLPSDELEVNGAIGIIDTQYDSYSRKGTDLSGNDIDTTPSHTANLSVAYYHPTGFYARTDIRNQGAMYFYDEVAKSFSKENGYTLVDAKFGYKFSDWDTYIYGKNLTDEEYINTYEANSLFSTATFGDPRFVGIGAKYTF